MNEEDTSPAAFDRYSYWKQVEQQRKEQETVVFTLEFSPDGNYAVAGSNFGTLAIWDLRTTEENTVTAAKKANKKTRSPAFMYTAHKGSIYGASFYNTNSSSYLVTCGEGDKPIRGWNWHDIVNRKQLQPVFTLEPQSSTEINAISIDHKAGRVYGAAGDNTGYIWDLNTQQCVGQLQGHSDYLHCITHRANGQILTGAEDGFIRFWDPRTCECVGALQPSKGTDRVWISCLAVDPSDAWLVCGGGSRYLSMWHLPSQTVASYMPTSGTAQDVTFAEDKIISVGNEEYIYHWQKDGKLLTRTPSQSRSLFSIAINPNNKALAVAGASPLIDMYSSFGSISSTLLFSHALLDS